MTTEEPGIRKCPSHHLQTNEGVWMTVLNGGFRYEAHFLCSDSGAKTETISHQRFFLLACLYSHGKSQTIQCFKQMPCVNQLLSHWSEILHARRRRQGGKNLTCSQSLDPTQWESFVAIYFQPETGPPKRKTTWVILYISSPASWESSKISSLSPIGPKCPFLAISVRLFYDCCVRICQNKPILGVKCSLFLNNCSKQVRPGYTLRK